MRNHMGEFAGGGKLLKLDKLMFSVFELFVGTSVIECETHLISKDHEDV